MLLLLAPLPAVAEAISVGATGGIPMSSRSQDFGEQCFVARAARLSPNETICGPNRFFARPYAVGPTLTLHLPRRVSVEAGVLYERFHRDVSHGVVAGRGGNIDFGQYFSVSANGWLFPLQLKYTFREKRLSPFAGAGATLRRLGPFKGGGIQLDFDLVPQPATFHIASGRDLDVALAVGAGVRWRAGALDVSPEVRFLRWTSAYYQPAQDQVMLVLSVALPLWKRK